jgi:hypothetical protein
MFTKPKTEIMDEDIIIKVHFKDEEYNFETRLVTAGYTHKFVVLINGLEVFYEPDEERNYRAIINTPDVETVTAIDRVLIRLVGEKIQAI